MTDPNLQKATELIAQAEKKMKSTQGFLGSFFGGSTKVEEAAELYVRAANSFKMAKQWKAAGDAFCEAAALQQRMDSKHEAGSRFVDAGTCYKKADPNQAVNSITRGIEIYTDMGRFSIAAKHHITIAEIYETELADTEKASVHYEQAADYYKGEESTSSANKCLLKVAHYRAMSEEYDKAINIYEEIAANAIENNLLRYGAKEYFFKALLCHMCVDLLNAQQALEKYEGMFPTFSDARECKLVKSLLAAMEEQEVDAFQDAVKDYDSISRLDQWTTTVLLRIKKSINAEDDLR